MLDIRDFGAVGDGVADDAASMQAALDACAGAGGEVFIPSGTYRITRSLLPHSNTLVMGGGYASAIMITDTGWDTLDHAEPPPRDNVNKGAITLAGEDPWGNPSRYLDNVRITNLRIFGGLNTKYEPTESDPFRYCPSFVFLQHCNRCRIDNCWFEDGHYSSIFVEGGRGKEVARRSGRIPSTN